MYSEEKKQYTDISYNYLRQSATENINLPDLDPNTHGLQPQLATMDQPLPYNSAWDLVELLNVTDNQLDSIDVQADSRNIKPDSINIEPKIEKKSSSPSLLKNILTHGVVKKQYKQRNGETNLVIPFDNPTVFNNHQQPYNLSQSCNGALPNQNPNYNNYAGLNSSHVTSARNASCYDGTSPNHQKLAPNYDYAYEYAAYNSANKIPPHNASWSYSDGTLSNQIEPNYNNYAGLNQFSQNNSSQSPNDGTPPNHMLNSNYDHVSFNNFYQDLPNNSSHFYNDGALPNQTSNLVHTNQDELHYQQQNSYYVENAMEDIKHPSYHNTYCNVLIPNAHVYHVYQATQQQAAQQQAAQQQAAQQQAAQQHLYYAQQKMNNNNRKRKRSDSETDEKQHEPPPCAYVEYACLKSRAQDNGTEQKRTRQTYTCKQTLMLEQCFRNGAYLNKKRREEMSKDLGLTERQIKIWFQNRRMKEKKQATRNVVCPVIVYNNLENWDISQL